MANLSIETLCGCSQVENSKQKKPLVRGKETNNPREERKDPFLCREENKIPVLPQRSVL